MKKLIFFLFFAALFATPFDFSKCYLKFHNIKYSVPVGKNLRVTFYKPKKYLFYDPFTGLYVFRFKNQKFVNLRNDYRLGWWMAAIKNGKVYGGTLAEDMKFLTPAKLSVKTPATAVVSDIFCRAYGVSGKNGFLRGDYIKHFAKYGYWGDIGIEADENMIVQYTDPFYAKGIKPGDRILMIDSKPANIETYEKFVILGKAGSVVVIKTDKGTFPLTVRKKMYDFTPLMHYGIKVNKKLEITSLPTKISEKYYISPPAKIIAVNSVKTDSFLKLKYLLSFHKNVTITVEKEGIKINIPLRK